MLDVGYAPNSFADSLHAAGWTCIGVDLCPRPGVAFPIIAADASGPLPFRPESFDLIVAGELIEHLIDQESFLRECYRLLRPGGRLVLTTPNLSFSINRLLILFGREPMFVSAPYHLHFHTRSSLTRLVKEAGLEILRVSASHLLYSRRRHVTGWVFELLADWLPAWGAHLIVFAMKPRQGTPPTGTR